MPVLLPYRTDPRLLYQVLEYAKGRGIDRSLLEARLGGGEPLRETLNALEQLGLIERNDAEIRLTEAGRRIAYAADPVQRQREWARVIMAYPPYGAVLERAIRAGLTVVDGPWVERMWQVELRLEQPRNRVEEARTFFFKLAEEAGFGIFRRGVRGQSSRLILAPEVAERIQAYRPREEAINPAASPVTAPPLAESPVQPEPHQRLEVPVAFAPVGGFAASLTITVDLTTWELEKIEGFFRLLQQIPGFQEVPRRVSQGTEDESAR